MKEHHTDKQTASNHRLQPDRGPRAALSEPEKTRIGRGG
jgi:hypothetical protein